MRGVRTLLLGWLLVIFGGLAYFLTIGLLNR
jgi:hypothetical protein